LKTIMVNSGVAVGEVEGPSAHERQLQGGS